MADLGWRRRSNEKPEDLPRRCRIGKRENATKLKVTRAHELRCNINST